MPCDARRALTRAVAVLAAVLVSALLALTLGGRYANAPCPATALCDVVCTNYTAGGDVSEWAAHVLPAPRPPRDTGSLLFSAAQCVGLPVRCARSEHVTRAGGAQIVCVPSDVHVVCELQRVVVDAAGEVLFFADPDAPVVVAPPAQISLTTNYYPTMGEPLLLMRVHLVRAAIPHDAAVLPGAAYASFRRYYSWNYGHILADEVSVVAQQARLFRVPYRDVRALAWGFEESGAVNCPSTMHGLERMTPLFGPRVPSGVVYHRGAPAEFCNGSDVAPGGVARRLLVGSTHLGLTLSDAAPAQVGVVSAWIEEALRARAPRSVLAHRDHVLFLRKDPEAADHPALWKNIDACADAVRSALAGANVSAVSWSGTTLREQVDAMHAASVVVTIPGGDATNGLMLLPCSAMVVPWRRTVVGIESSLEARWYLTRMPDVRVIELPTEFLRDEHLLVTVDVPALVAAVRHAREWARACMAARFGDEPP